MKNPIVYLVIILLSIPLLTNGKKRHRYIVPQFEFTQIDSLVDSGVAKRVNSDSTSFVVGYVSWPIGGRVDTKGKWAHHENHFEIFFLFKQKNKFRIQKVDNFGFFKIRKVKGAKLKRYIDEYVDDMAGEVLRPKIDTLYNSDGTVEGTRQTLTDHKLYEEVKIINGTGKVDYKYNDDYSRNKANLGTKKYGLLKALAQKRTHFNKRKHRRISVVWYDVSDEQQRY